MPSDAYAVCVHIWYVSKREIFIKLFYNYGLTTSYDILLNVFIWVLKQFPFRASGLWTHGPAASASCMLELQARAMMPRAAVLTIIK